MKNKMIALILMLALVCSVCCGAAGEADAMDGVPEAAAEKPAAETEIPEFSEVYPGKEAELRKLGGQEKTTLFTGPGINYMTIGKVNPREKNTVTAYFIENDMVYTHYVHRQMDTWAYIKKGAFEPESLAGVPETDALPYVMRKTTEDVTPLTGPGPQYEKWTGPAIPAGSEVRCYLMNGKYGMVEYNTGNGPARVWAAICSDEMLQLLRALQEGTVPQTGTETTAEPDAPGGGEPSAAAGQELTFLDMEWGTDVKTAAEKLTEAGLVETSRDYFHYNSQYICFWPGNELQFADWTAWNVLPEIFGNDSPGAVGLTFVEPLKKKVGGYTPQSAFLNFLNGIGEDGRVDSEKTELISACFEYDTRNNPQIFVNILEKLEAKYGKFTRYMGERLENYTDVYGAISGCMEGAGLYASDELGSDTYLLPYAICTLHGDNDTAIVLMIDDNADVTLLYGKTDATERIAEIQKALEAEK